MHFCSCFRANSRWFFVFTTWKEKLSKMLTYISSLFVEIKMWKFRIIFAVFEEIISQSFSLFTFIIRKKEHFFWEGPRLMDNPLCVFLFLLKPNWRIISSSDVIIIILVSPGILFLFNRKFNFSQCDTVFSLQNDVATIMPDDNSNPFIQERKKKLKAKAKKELLYFHKKTREKKKRKEWKNRVAMPYYSFTNSTTYS